MEVSRTQVFDRPLRGRELFEEVIRDNLSLGRPSEVQLLFQRRITRRTPGRFQTRVVTQGVLPSLHIEYKHSRVKQYFKEGRALRTETTINDAYDFGVGRWLTNFSTLQTIGRELNSRLLEQECLTHSGGMDREAFAELLAPARTPAGQPIPALRFGQPRVTALLQALCLFALTPSGITNSRLRPLVAQLLGLGPEEYTTRQMGYDLRRLARKGLIQRVGRHLRYEVTPRGQTDRALPHDLASPCASSRSPCHRSAPPRHHPITAAHCLPSPRPRNRRPHAKGASRSVTTSTETCRLGPHKEG